MWRREIGYRRGEMVQVDYFLFGKSSGIYTLASATHFPAFSSRSNGNGNNNNNLELRFCLAWFGSARLGLAWAIHVAMDICRPTTARRRDATRGDSCLVALQLIILCTYCADYVYASAARDQ